MEKEDVNKHEKIQKKESMDTENSIKSIVMRTKIKALVNICFYAVIGPAILYTLFFIYLNYQESRKMSIQKFQLNELNKRNLEQYRSGLEERSPKPSYWVWSKKAETSHLKHVFEVLDRLNFRKVDNETDDWDLLWAHDYPFTSLSTKLQNLKPYQKVNHLPGCGYFTNKVDLSISGSQFMPAAFRIPGDKNAFLKYLQENPNKLFVEKSNDHRGIQIKNISDIRFDSNSENFIQEFVDRPFLVDGYKFDIGIYTLITSINPLRTYVYTGDVLLRFCPTLYYPFDPNDVDKYVVGDDYLPIWNVPSLRKFYVDLGYSMKETLDAYIRIQGKDPSVIWENINNAIREILLKKEMEISKVVHRFSRKSARNYFELVRFDFVIDEDLDVFMMEANMSPNLSSAHYPPNRLLYEQVIFDAFSLLGLTRKHREITNKKNNNDGTFEMEVADKNLVVLPKLCASCEDCFRVECQLCKPCFTEETRLILSQSYLEHQNRMNYRRIFPPSVGENTPLKDYTLRNQLLVRWYQGKCEMDPTWCD